MRKVIHAELFFQPESRESQTESILQERQVTSVEKTPSTELEKLLADWSSCVRFAYNRFREGLDFNAVRRVAKEKYPSLNTRQISDAVTEAKGKHERTKREHPIVFGGKKLFRKVCAGQVPVEQWRFVRDGMVYARGDRTKSGNPNLRVIKTPRGYEMRITVGHREFRQFPLFVPEKFRAELDDLLASGTAYNVRLRRKDREKYRVVIDYEIGSPPVIATRRNGVIGVSGYHDLVSQRDLLKEVSFCSQRRRHDNPKGGHQS
jgi:hypothetical protein